MRLWDIFSDLTSSSLSILIFQTGSLSQTLDCVFSVEGNGYGHDHGDNLNGPPSLIQIQNRCGVVAAEYKNFRDTEELNLRLLIATAVT